MKPASRLVHRVRSSVLLAVVAVLAASVAAQTAEQPKAAAGPKLSKATIKRESSKP